MKYHVILLSHAHSSCLCLDNIHSCDLKAFCCETVNTKQQRIFPVLCQSFLFMYLQGYYDMQLLCLTAMMPFNDRLKLLRSVVTLLRQISVTKLLILSLTTLLKIILIITLSLLRRKCMRLSNIVESKRTKDEDISKKGTINSLITLKI